MDKLVLDSFEDEEVCEVEDIISRWFGPLEDSVKSAINLREARREEFSGTAKEDREC